MSFTAIILAAGKGTRMKSALPKPLHQVAGQPMLAWVMNAAAKAGAAQILPVVGNDSAQIRQWLEGQWQEGHTVAIQKPQMGTGHGVLAARAQIEDINRPVIVLFADTPLISASTIDRLLRKITDGADICGLGFETDTPAGYGRFILDEAGALSAIVEDSECSDAERAITFVNGGILAAKGPLLFSLLETLEPANSKGEIFLTDIISAGRHSGAAITCAKAPAEELAGVNDRAQLAQIEAIVQNQLRHTAMMAGATLIAPDTVYLSADTTLAPDVIIDPHVVIGRGVHIESGSHIKSFSHLESCHIGARCIIGPYARLRPGTELQDGVRIGNFVEVKNAHFGAGAKANHLSYIGDAEVGDSANIGAGTITCNYDGFAKHKTKIGKAAFIGSNSALVAPVVIGDGAIVGAGSTITKDVEGNALVTARAKQSQIPLGAERLRAKRTKAND